MAEIVSPPLVIWLSSGSPDFVEEQLLACLPVPVTLARDPDQAAQLSRERPKALLFANFTQSHAAIDAVEFIRKESESLTILVRDRNVGPGEAFALAQLGVSRVFDAQAETAAMLSELALALERSDSQHTRSARLGRPAWQESLIGEGSAMLQICEIIRLVASRRSTVLISGETGTGKEVAARALHQASMRSALPMVAVNCTAIPENLLEAELFGYVRGAFTGAQQMRIGRFEQAHRSTLFLDEIGDMPLDLQSKLLRVLQEREFQRLGSSETVKVDVRIIAASNVDLTERIRQGLFREDLFYRLNVVPLRMPALRERPEDIPALVSYFIEKICKDENIPRKSLSSTAVPKLIGYSWPGNVRQLENAVEMAIVMSGERSTLTAADFRLPAAVETQPAAVSAMHSALPDHGLDFEQAVSQFERNILSQALRRTGGNKKLAADMLGLKRTTLSAKVRTLETLIGCALA